MTLFLVLIQSTGMDPFPLLLLELNKSRNSLKRHLKEKSRSNVTVGIQKNLINTKLSRF